MAKSKLTKEDIARIQEGIDKTAELRDVTESVADAVQSIAQGQSDLIGFQDQQINLNRASRDISRELIKLDGKKGGLTKKEYNARKKNLESAQKDVEASRDKNKALSDVSKTLNIVNDQAGELIGSAKGFVEALPGGGMLSKLVGLDNLADDFADALNDAGDVFVETAAAGGDASAAAMESFGGSLKGLLNPTMLLVAAIGGLVALFMSVSKEAKEIQEATGASYSQAKAMVKEANKMVASGKTQLATTGDILDVQKEISAEFGNTMMMSSQVAGEVADIGKSFGYGAQQAGKVNAAFMGMGVSAGDAADAQRDLAADALKAGVNVGTVMADIADNSKTVSKYFGGNVKALKKAAIEAAKLGVSLETMAGVADGLLDFESSISAQFELQALTGKQMNFDLARQLALEGDIAGATKEVLNQVGSIHDFNKMDVLERKKLAEATGMSVDELQKSLTIQDKMANATDEQRAAAMGLNLSAAELSNLSSEDLQKKVAQQQAQEKMNNAMAQFKATLVDALMPAAEALMGIFGAMAPLLKLVGAAVAGILAPIKLVFSVVEYIVTGISDLLDSIGLLGPMMTVIKGAFMIIGTVLTAGILPSAYAWLSTTISNMLANSTILTTLGTIAVTGVTVLANALAWTASIVAQAFTALPAIGSAMLGVATTLVTTVLPSVLSWTASVMLQAFTAIPAILSGLGAAAVAVVPLIASALTSAASFLGAAVGAIFTGLGMIPFGLGIPIAIAAVAGMIGLFMKAKSANDLVSRPSGGGGYGSRILMAPEGTFAFNNKDTIVAGTDLGIQNDYMSGPPGSIKMNDGAIGPAGSGDPAEANIVDMDGDVAGKLAAALGIGLTPAVIAAFAAAVPVLVAGMTMAVTMGNVASFAMTAPLLFATITAATVAGTIAGYMATALIPKPVIAVLPILTFEMNPMTYSMMGGIMGGISGLFGGGGNKEEEDPVAKIEKKLDDVVAAISNMQINMDGKKVGEATRVAGSFRRQ
jgi:hypothetical protein